MQLNGVFQLTLTFQSRMQVKLAFDTGEYAYGRRASSGVSLPGMRKTGVLLHDMLTIKLGPVSAI